MTRRFSRQNKIKWWDQKKISNSNVCVVGCGGIGCNTALQLVFLGIRKMILIDMDKVEESNLNRQFFYEEDIGKYKAEALKEKLSKINTKVKIEYFNTPLDQVHTDNFKNVGFFFDCLDNIETREKLSEYCWDQKIPFIHSACSDVIGEVQLQVRGKTTKMNEYPLSMKEEEGRKSCKDFDPSVCTTNMIVASLQVDKFLDYLVRKDTSKPNTHYIRGGGVTYG